MSNPCSTFDGKVNVLYDNHEKESIDAIYLDLSGTNTSINLSNMLEELDGKRVKLTVEVIE